MKENQDTLSRSSWFWLKTLGRGQLRAEGGNPEIFLAHHSISWFEEESCGVHAHVPGLSPQHSDLAHLHLLCCLLALVQQGVHADNTDTATDFGSEYKEVLVGLDWIGQFCTTSPGGILLGLRSKSLGWIPTVAIPIPDQLPLIILLTHPYFCTERKLEHLKATSSQQNPTKFFRQLSISFVEVGILV